MKKWLRRVRGALGMGLTWAVAWAIGGVLVGATSILLPGLPWDTFFEVFDAPLPALAMPGFVGGALFSVVLGIAGRRRRFHELSLPRFAALGAVGGLLLSLVPAAMVAVGLASLGTEARGLWQITAVISVPFILLSAASAAGSLMLARMAEGPESLGVREEGADVRLTDREAPELVGEGSLDDNPVASQRERVRSKPARGQGDA